MTTEKHVALSGASRLTAELGFCKSKDGMDSLLDAEPRIGLVGHHEHGTNLMRWVQLAVVLPCLVVGAPTQAADKGAELSNSGVMADVCLSEKCAGVRPVEVGTVKPALFEESERRIKGGPQTIGRNEKPTPVLTNNIEDVRDKPGCGPTGSSKQPQVNSGECAAEDVHPGFKAFIIGMWVAVFLSLFSTPENTVLALQKPNDQGKGRAR